MREEKVPTVVIGVEKSHTCAWASPAIPEFWLVPPTRPGRCLVAGPLWWQPAVAEAGGAAYTSGPQSGWPVEYAPDWQPWP